MNALILIAGGIYLIFTLFVLVIIAILNMQGKALEFSWKHLLVVLFWPFTIMPFLANILNDDLIDTAEWVVLVIMLSFWVTLIAGIYA